MTFNSTVFNILKQTVEKGVEVRIDPTLSSVEPARVKKVDYWSTEGIVNVVFLVLDGAGSPRVRDWRYRPLSGASFDEAFTIKKVDGVLTLMKRPRPVEDET